MLFGLNPGDQMDEFLQNAVRYPTVTTVTVNEPSNVTMECHRSLLLSQGGTSSSVGLTNGPSLTVTPLLQTTSGGTPMHVVYPWKFSWLLFILGFVGIFFCSFSAAATILELYSSSLNVS